jgi:SAM-dependent methyltransferase
MSRHSVTSPDLAVASGQARARRLPVDDSLEAYNDAKVVAHYVNASDLQPCELDLFDRFISFGASVLDIGVGGGRTTPYLSRRAGRYLGLDYASSMVEACQKRFPDLEFRCEDATDLSSIPDNSFDIVVFSFNGIDCIPTDDGRRKCFGEVFRVLKPGGKFIFSSHNAKALGVWPMLSGVGPLKKGWRILRAIGKTPFISLRQLRTRAFYAGSGYILDPVHGGLKTYTSTPGTIGPEIQSVGFNLVEVVGHPFTKRFPGWLVRWYYYVLLRPRN